jgi:Putative beta-barrel porin-2, OmpL-like. bbp2
LHHSNTDVRVVPTRLFLPEAASVVLSLGICLFGRPVIAQQSSIPRTGGLSTSGSVDGFGSEPGPLSSNGDLFAANSPTAPNVDFVQVYQEIQQTVPLPDAIAGPAPNLTPGDLPAVTYQGVAQPTAPATYAGTDKTAVASGNPSAFDTGPKTYDSFLNRLGKAFFNPEEQEKELEANTRRGQVIPWTSPPFPFSDHVGPTIGYKDTTVWPLMDAIYNGPNGDWWKKSRIKIYGWADPAVTFGTSKRSNVPLSYSIVPNSLQLSQAILIFERVTDSVQKDHVDWGFKFTNLYGIDYRYTTAKGYFSDQLLKHNRLYGYDPLQMYVDLYLPHVAEGMIIRAGRYISPIDIEAQLSPENYLYTHSLMYTYDPYTFTGIQFITKLNEQFTLQLGAQAGNDMAPWTTSSQPNGEFLVKWVSKSGRDSLFGGVDSVGKGQYLNGHDDLQIGAITWSHKVNEKLHTLTEAYMSWERNALQGGTVTNGPPQPFFTGVGPGKFLPGISDAFGLVNYTPYKLSDKAYVVLRNDVLYDPRGFRTGVPGTVAEVTLGLAYHITPWCVTRPEIRFDYGTQKVYDDNTKRDQFTFNWDIIVRF